MVWQYLRFVFYSTVVVRLRQSKLLVGTPPQEISVVFDTGSETLEFASTQCGDPCANQPKFDTSQSSTYVNHHQTTSISFETGIGVDPITSDSEFVLTLQEGEDTVTVGGIAVPNVDLYTIIDQTAAFAIDPFSGIQGMSRLVSPSKAPLTRVNRHVITGSRILRWPY